MWIRVPGRIRLFLALAGFLTLAPLVATPAPAARRGPGEALAEPAPPVAEPEIVFTGKMFASLKRRVDLVFPSIITELLVNSGQRVEAGEVLAKYHLTPAGVLALRQRLFPGQITEMEVKLTQVERSLAPLKDKQRELTQLVKQKLAPPESLSQVNREIQLVSREQAALTARLRRERHTLQVDRSLLRQQLGSSVNEEQIPQDGAVKAPISGYVIWVSPEVRQGAELGPAPAVFQIGVMDPMVVRAQAFEIESLQIRPGESAAVTLESLPGRKFEGKVSRVSWSSITPSLDQPSYYEVELQVPNPDLLLKEGLKASITFKK